RRFLVLSGLVSCRGCFDLAVWSVGTCPQAFFHRRRNESGDVAAKAEDFLHEPRADEGELLSGEKKNSFESGLQAAIHERHLQLVFVIGNSADAAEDYASVLAERVVREESFKRVDFDIGKLARRFAQHFGSLGN